MKKSKRMTLKGVICTCFAALLTGMLVFDSVYPCPPHPDLLKARTTRESAALNLSPLPNSTDLHARGIDLPEDRFGTRRGGRNALEGPSVRRFHILALLVDFSDHEFQTSATFFDTLVFGPGIGTVSDYFDEISYGKIDLVTVNLPSTLDWTRAPQQYAYYTNNFYGIGLYPRNSQKLVEELVDAVDTVVDFSDYDNDSDGYVDMLVVIHAGPGAELSGNTGDIWSHKWAISPRLTGDGVHVSTYTIQPEFWLWSGDMTCGVFCHEMMHGFGLPDLHDIEDASSNGIGRWDIMAAGAWNGILGNSPAHPCAWGLAKLGLARVRNVTTDRLDLLIRPVAQRSGFIYRLWTSGVKSNEYFLVENRQRVGYDAALPGEGLLIWHIDDTKTNNDKEWYPGLPERIHYLVALEQADGLYELEHANDFGDASDPWPGSRGRTSFNGGSVPSSDGYGTGDSFVAVENISVTTQGIRADLLVGSLPARELTSLSPIQALPPSQNYPNPFNPTTEIVFNVPDAADVILEIYNLLGQRVTTLIDGLVNTGEHRVKWDGLTDSGQPVATGVYFYRLQIGDFTETKKMLLLK